MTCDGETETEREKESEENQSTILQTLQISDVPRRSVPYLATVHDLMPVRFAFVRADEILELVAL